MQCLSIGCPRKLRNSWIPLDQSDILARGLCPDPEKSIWKKCWTRPSPDSCSRTAVTRCGSATNGIVSHIESNRRRYPDRLRTSIRVRSFDSANNALGASVMWSADGVFSRTRYIAGRRASCSAGALLLSRSNRCHVGRRRGPATETLHRAGSERHKQWRLRMQNLNGVSQLVLSKRHPTLFVDRAREPGQAY
jgi:hypothetical protein